MHVRENFAEREIKFVIRKDDADILDKLSFVHLIKMKFDGEEVKCAWFQAKGNDPYIQVVLVFADWSITSNAKGHCDQHLDDSGSVVLSYKGALPYADRGQGMARDLLKRALAHRLDI